MPYQDLFEINSIDLMSIFKPVIETAKRTFNLQFKIDLPDFNEKNIKYERDSLELYKSAVFINITGIIKGIFVLTVNEKLAAELTKKFIIEPPNDDDLKEYYGYSVSEILNVILGNSLKLISNIEQSVLIEPPYIFRADCAELKYHGSAILVCNSEFNDKKIKLCFITCKSETRNL